MDALGFGGAARNKALSVYGEARPLLGSLPMERMRDLRLHARGRDEARQLVPDNAHARIGGRFCV